MTKPPRKKQKVRRPNYKYTLTGEKDISGARAILNVIYLTEIRDAKEARKLATWLIKASEYLESKGEK